MPSWYGGSVVLGHFLAKIVNVFKHLDGFFNPSEFSPIHSSEWGTVRKCAPIRT